jgi:2,5-dihydroxypyridine 5,6-dioxygenase
MLADRIEAKWIDTFDRLFDLCRVRRDEDVVILSETQSRALNVHLAELALLRRGARVFHVVMPTPPQRAPVPIRSTGASQALAGNRVAVAALAGAGAVVDLTVEGLMHAPETPDILKGGARIINISNEHPEALERLLPDESLKARTDAARKRLKAAREMRVTSAAGTDLTARLEGAVVVGVHGWTDRPGSLSHFPGGIALAFPKAGSVSGRLVLDAGDINLTFKRYLETQVVLTLADDYVTAIDGAGADAKLFRRYIAAWGDREAYATSHVGYGVNTAARYEALAMYDKRDTNGTEQRAWAGNFLYSTGANEFAGRYTAGHFDLPVGGCTILLDGVAVVRDGELVEDAA